MESILQIVTAPITAHTFNKAKDMVAICPNTTEVHIYQLQAGKEWKQVYTLKGHDKLVTCLDWAPNTNRIVSCSQDRNAYVWNLEGQEWKPTLVLLRINRAATFVRWSPLENKFAVASGSRCVSVCYFDQEHDWWVSKHLKKPIRSTVLSVDWHPNNVLLACGSADMKCRVFSAYMKGVDEKPKPSPWGERLPFNTLCAEYSSGHGSWTHSVQFSPDGNMVAWASHDSSISVADPAKGTVKTVNFAHLPCLSLIWISSKSIVAAGYDCQPFLFSGDDQGEWTFVEKLDQVQKKAAGAGGNSAFNKFKQMDSRAQEGPSTDTELKTTHQNTINSVRVFASAGEQVTKFSTGGVDGQIVVWDVKSIESGIAGLKIR